MPIVSLISRPGGLDPALPEALRNAWGGGDVVWLAPDEAAEFDVAHVPESCADTGEDIRAQGVDLCVTPSEGRVKRMLIADMDSTMIAQECIDELADAAGVGAQVADITARAMNGELDFEAALLERVGLLKGQPASLIDQVLADRITFAQGARTLVATMKHLGSKAALVSGGFTQFADEVGNALGFDVMQANSLCIEDDVLTGDVARPILGRDAKVTALNTLSAQWGFDASDALAVGDGANDLGMLQAAGLGAAVHAKPTVAAAAPTRIDHGDLTALLYLQGIPKSEFV